MALTSIENKEIKEYCKLNQKKYRDKHSSFVVEGFHLVEEAYRKNLLEKIIVLEEVENPFDMDPIYVTQEVMKKLSTLDTIPNMIGICAMPDYQDIVGDRILLLDNIQDPGNLGTIIRSSKAFNVDTIVLSKDTVDLYNPKVVRATQGFLFHINIVKKDLKEVIEDLKNKNYPIYSTSVVHGSDVKKIGPKSRYALIVGNEGKGVSKEISELADSNLYIRMNDSVESLNVGVATSILLYELAGEIEEVI